MHDTTDIIMDYLELPRPIALVLDAAGNIEHLSDDACTVLGYSLADLLGVNWISQCLPSSWQLKTKTIFDSLIHQGGDESEQYVYPIVSKNGERFIFSWHSEARRDPSGNYIGSITTGIKIRDNALQEKNSLLQSAARNQAVLDNAIEAILSINSSGTITHANKTTEKIFGYHESELIGNNIWLLLPDAEFGGSKDDISKYLEAGNNGGGFNQELQARHRNGSSVLIELTVAEIVIAGVRSFTGIMRDIRERKLNEEHLRQSQEEVQQARDHLAHLDRLHIASEMSTSIAHELNQPLTAISMYAQACRNLLKKGPLDNQALLPTLSRIDKQAQRAGEIIRNIRTLVGKQNPHHQLTDINTLIENTIELAQVDVDCRAIRFECDFSEQLPMMEIVLGQIQQVLLNLIRNACDAMINTSAEQKCIRITSENQPSGFITIRVSDHGIGINRDHSDKLFRAFFSTKSYGMGMGLAISHSIISNHGGEMKINHQYQDGAEIMFTLPIMPILRGQPDEH
jgi:two-component system sensor kinase FixL|tara:strand:+ start:49510 stop:51048 length:1539 start_codon:yes stop_codon:yes gene_type:complete